MQSRYLLLCLAFAIFLIPLCSLGPASTLLQTPVPSPIPTTEANVQIEALQGGEISLADGMRLSFPAGSLVKDTKVSVRSSGDHTTNPKPAKEIVSLSPIYDITLESSSFSAPATLEIPFDPALLPQGVGPDQVFLSYFDESSQQWKFAGGELIPGKNVIALSITHASLWQVSTWNKEAWVALVSNLMSGNFVEKIQAIQQFTEECPQAGNNVQVIADPLKAVFVEGCVKLDDPEHPVLQVVNPRAFYFEVMQASSGKNYFAQKLLAPGDRLEFTADTSDPSPLVINAVISHKAASYLVMHLVLSMLPGFNQLGGQSEIVACMTENLSLVSPFVNAAKALSEQSDESGLVAAEDIREFLTDKDAQARLIESGKKCKAGPARTWNMDLLSKVGASMNSYLAATDELANFTRTNGVAEISFQWTKATASMNDFTANIVWNPGVEIFSEVYCTDLDHIISGMKKHNATSESIEIVKSLDGKAIVTNFKEMGKVDLAEFTYQCMNHDKKHVLVNGDPKFVYAEYSDEMTTQLERNPDYIRIKNKYPEMYYWFDQEFIEEQSRQQGGQRFIFLYSFRACNSCSFYSAHAFIGYDFDSSGKYLGLQVLSVSENKDYKASMETPLPNPTFPSALQTLDHKNPQSILDWFQYGIEHQDEGVFAQLFSQVIEEKLAYVYSIEGGQPLTIPEIIRDLKNRLSSHPKCDGYTGADTTEDDRFVIWTSGWVPSWEMHKYCYVSCMELTPVRRTKTAGFAFYPINGEYKLSHIFLNDDLKQQNMLYGNKMPCIQPVSSLKARHPPYSSCPGAPNQRMVIGQQGSICTKSDAVILREKAKRSAENIGSLSTGTIFDVIGGPKCDSGWSYWQVRTASGLVGWLSEGGDSVDPYFICPLP